MSEIESLQTEALAAISAAAAPDALEALRVSLLGKSGRLTAQLKSLGALPPEARKSAGEAINRARDAISEALAARKAVLDAAALDARLAVRRPVENQLGLGGATHDSRISVTLREIVPSRYTSATMSPMTRILCPSS